MAVHANASLGARTFVETDQEFFAGISGDRNPMHMDAVAARRTQAGAPVVHGVHTVLWAANLLLGSRPDTRFAELKVRFERFIYLGEEVEAVLVGDDVDVTIELRTQGARVAVITLARASSWRAPEVPAQAPAGPIGPVRERSIEELRDLTGAFVLAGDEGALTSAFPALVATLGVEPVRSLAGLSTLVGMECPGLLSIFSKLHVAIDPDDAGSGDGALYYKVRRIQPLLRSTVIDVRAPGLTGTIEAFVRQPPTTQPASAALRTMVPERFADGHRVLVVGGSRGLGELTAKLAALAGAQVTITYARGHAEAQAVAAEIAAAGGICDILQFDVRAPATPSAIPVTPIFTHCYYYATSPIFRHRGALYDRDALNTFLAFYVDGLASLIETLADANPAVRIFTPSTSAIDEQPKGALEYVMAKLAGERLVQDMARNFAQARIETARFPRILTDQTATVLPVRSEDPLDLLLPIMRDLHRED